MTALGAVFYVGARPFAESVIDDANVTEIATQFIRLLALSQPAMAVHFAMSGALRGAADVRSPLLGAVIAMYGVRLPCALLAAFAFDLPLVWAFIGMVGDHHARALVLFARWRSPDWETVVEHSDH